MIINNKIKLRQARVSISINIQKLVSYLKFLALIKLNRKLLKKFINLYSKITIFQLYFFLVNLLT